VSPQNIPWQAEWGHHKNHASPDKLSDPSSVFAEKHRDECRDATVYDSASEDGSAFRSLGVGEGVAFEVDEASDVESKK